MRAFRLTRGVQATLSDRAVGIHVMSPDPADLAARIGVGSRPGEHVEAGRTFLVRAGDQIDVGDLVLLTTNVVIGDAGYVEFDIMSESADASTEVGES